MHARTHPPIHACTHMHPHTYTHTHTHTYTHTDTDMHTHTQTHRHSDILYAAFFRILPSLEGAWLITRLGVGVAHTHTHLHTHFDAPPLMLTDHTCNWSSFHVYTHTHRAMTTHAHRHTNRHTRRHKHTHNLGWSLQRIKQPQTAYSGRGSPQCSGQDCRRCQRRQRAIGQPASQTSRPLEPTSPH